MRRKGRVTGVIISKSAFDASQVKVCTTQGLGHTAGRNLKRLHNECAKGKREYHRHKHQFKRVDNAMDSRILPPLELFNWSIFNYIRFFRSILQFLILSPPKVQAVFCILS
jgi:hypothetical protein